mgnify:CR=1 FL=1
MTLILGELGHPDKITGHIEVAGIGYPLEFGRRVYENASLGTDHGRGFAFMALGDKVKGGRILGSWPIEADTGDTNLHIPGPGGTLKLRIYHPDAAGELPALFYVHGGGYVIGDLETHDAVCRTLCHDVGAVVVAVDYRLAPEHPFPAAVDDVICVLRWLATHARAMRVDPAAALRQ